MHANAVAKKRLRFTGSVRKPREGPARALAASPNLLFFECSGPGNLKPIGRRQIRVTGRRWCRNGASQVAGRRMGQCGLLRRRASVAGAGAPGLDAGPGPLACTNRESHWGALEPPSARCARGLAMGAPTVANPAARPVSIPAFSALQQGWAQAAPGHAAAGAVPAPSGPWRRWPAGERAGFSKSRYCGACPSLHSTPRRGRRQHPRPSLGSISQAHF